MGYRRTVTDERRGNIRKRRSARVDQREAAESTGNNGTEKLEVLLTESLRLSVRKDASVCVYVSSIMRNLFLLGWKCEK